MSGGNEREDEAYARGLNEYYKTLDREDRLSAAWTLGQLSLELSGAVTSAIREKVPGWKAGEQIPAGMLDEIFSGKTIEAIMTRKAEAGREVKRDKRRPPYPVIGERRSRAGHRGAFRQSSR